MKKLIFSLDPDAGAIYAGCAGEALNKYCIIFNCLAPGGHKALLYRWPDVDEEFQGILEECIQKCKEDYEARNV